MIEGGSGLRAGVTGGSRCFEREREREGACVSVALQGLQVAAGGRAGWGATLLPQPMRPCSLFLHNTPAHRRLLRIPCGAVRAGQPDSSNPREPGGLLLPAGLEAEQEQVHCSAAAAFCANARHGLEALAACLGLPCYSCTPCLAPPLLSPRPSVPCGSQGVKRPPITAVVLYAAVAAAVSEQPHHSRPAARHGRVRGL